MNAVRARLEAASDWADEMVGLLLPIAFLTVIALGVALAALLVAVVAVKITGGGC